MQSRICDVFENRPIRFHGFVPWFYSARKQLYASRCDARKMVNFSHEFGQANFCESYFKTKETEKNVGSCSEIQHLYALRNGQKLVMMQDRN